MGPASQLADAVKRHLGPWVVWGLTLAACVWVVFDLRYGTTVVGFAHGVDHEVAPLLPGRVATVAVDVGQEVTVGQVLATLDPAEVEQEIAVVQAERSRAESEIAMARAASETESAERERDLAADLARAERDLARARADADAAGAELRSLDVEKRRLRGLVDAQLADRAPLAGLEARAASLQAAVEGARRQVALGESQVEEARRRYEALTDQVEVAVLPLLRELDVIDGRLRALRARRAALVLRSPADGRVAQVHLQPGSVAGPTEPVVSIVSSGGGRVVACVAEEQALDVRVGDGATIWPRTQGGEPVSGRVVALGPIVEQVPTRCRPNLRDRAWGRDVVIALDQRAALIPGQALDVRLERAETPLDGARAAPPGTQDGAPRRMEVPAELAKRTRFEPSGLVWVARLARFVLVSDDTGTKKTETARAPWLFTMDPAGRVDPAPLPISGLDEVDDLEAIAAGDGETLYVLSSQGVSKDGDRRPSRETFARLRPGGAGYEVDGAVHLVGLLEGLAPEKLEELGLADTKRLDVEGLAVYEGALLLGLKSPLDADGRAILWRLERPEELFETGRLDPSRLRVWAKVGLEVEADGRPAPAGIADLLALPDGTLVLAATAAAGDPDRQSGALFQVHEPAPGNLDARRFRVFEGHKPEGLALSPSPGRLVVAFDTGGADPLWTEIPWPGR